MIPFAEYTARVEETIVNDYGIRVVTRDVPDPLVGDLDGCEIHIDYALNPEQRLFLLAHLFGHTVQWNVDPAAFELGKQRVPPVETDLLPAIMAYERQAARYALALFHQVGIMDADQWLSDQTACDLAYLEHYYRTGEKREFRSFWCDHTARIEPLAIPPFVPTRRIFRRDGIVI